MLYKGIFINALLRSIYMELIMAETLVGKYLITRNIDTARYGFAASVETMVVDFLPLLEIT